MKKLISCLALLTAFTNSVFAQISAPTPGQNPVKNDASCDSTCSRDAGIAATFVPTTTLQTCVTKYEEQSVVCDAPYTFALYKKTRKAVYCNNMLASANAWAEDKTTCSDTCTTTQELQINACAPPASGFIYENRQRTSCALTGTTYSPWSISYQNCVATYAPACITQPPLTQSFACPSGFSGTYLTTNYFDATPGICNYTTFSSSQNTTCIPAVACTYMPATSQSFACPSGFSGFYTVNTTYNSTPGICAYNTPTDDSATQCTPTAKTYQINDAAFFIGNSAGTQSFAFYCPTGSTSDAVLVNDYTASEAVLLQGYPDYYLTLYD